MVSEAICCQTGLDSPGLTEISLRNPAQCSVSLTRLFNTLNSEVLAINTTRPRIQFLCVFSSISAHTLIASWRALTAV